MFRPRQHIILMIGDDGIVTVPHNIYNATPFFLPAEDRQTAKEIVDFITRYPQARVTLFADNLAQDYRSDILPKLNFFDRAKLLRRRLRQNFPLARLTASLRFKKSRDGVLMIGVHESNPVFAWAERLRARLPQIALLPVEGASVVGKLMPDGSEWNMLISRQKSGGFRQIVVRNSELVFTRLTPLPASDAPEDIAETISRDIAASLDYLTRHGLHDCKELAVLLLLPGTLHETQALADLQLRSIRSLSPFRAALELKLPFAPQTDDDAGDLLFAAHMIASRGPVLPLMLPDTQAEKQTQTLIWWGLRTSCICLAVAIFSTIWGAGDLASTLYQTQKEADRLAQTRHTLEQAQASAAPVTEPLGHMRQALERRHIFEQKTPMPWPGLNELANGLDGNEQITRLEWKKPEDAPESFDLTLRVIDSTPDSDRADNVAAFTRVTHTIAHAMPDFKIAEVKPPYPALPQESVTAGQAEGTPTGEITLQRSTP